MHIMQLYSSNGVADIWTRAMYPYPYPWLSLVILGYPFNFNANLSQIDETELREF